MRDDKVGEGKGFGHSVLVAPFRVPQIIITVLF